MQKALISTEAGLSFDQLGVQQWQSLQAILARDLPGVTPVGGAISLAQTDGYPQLIVHVMEQGKEEPQVSSYQYCLPSKTPEEQPVEEAQ